MADEIANEQTGYQIEILGINWNVGFTGSNDLMTAGRQLPWLQDTPGQNVQGEWAPRYRDVVIVDGRNEKIGEFNLTDNSLASQSAYDTFKSMLLAAAEFEDADGDGLGDDWEDMVLGDRTNTGNDDKDSDRADNFSEFAFGCDGGDPASIPFTTPSILDAGDDGLFLQFTFRRRLGTAGGLSYKVEYSDGFGDWVRYDAKALERDRVNPYDGTGTVEVTCRLPDPIALESGEPAGFLRVVAERP